MNIRNAFPGSRRQAPKRLAAPSTNPVRSGGLPHGRALIHVGVLLCWASHAWAEDTKTASLDPVVEAVKATELTAQAEETRELREKYARLAPKGFNLGLPGPADTIAPDAGGLRAALAEHGIGWFGLNLFNVAQNVRSNSARSLNGKQQYNGQTFTWFDNLLLGVTYDLAQYGVPDGQLYVSGFLSRASWQPISPNKLSLAEAYYYQTFLDKRFSLKAGYLINTWEFINTNVGGSLSTSVFGASGSIPFQGGYASNGSPRPAVVLRYNINNEWYAKGTAQRAVDPDGLQAEADANPSALHWKSPNAGVLYMGELGYQRNAAEGVAQQWIRGGGAYNTSRYSSFEKPGTRVDHNAFYYLLADRQVWQVAPSSSPARGFYVGASAMYAPPYANAVSQYYELRLYGKGLFDSRPYDMVSLVMTDTVWGSDAVNLTASKGSLVHRDSKAVTLTYSARVRPGVYAGLGIGYVNHPTSIAYQPNTGSALNVLGSLNIFF